MYSLGIAQPLSTQILQIYRICKDAIDLTSRWKVRFRQKFVFKMKYEGCFLSMYWLHTLSIIFKGCIVSWGNFGHGATSVKKSLRNHFGRINNVKQVLNTLKQRLMNPYIPGVEMGI